MFVVAVLLCGIKWDLNEENNQSVVFPCLRARKVGAGALEVLPAVEVLLPLFDALWCYDKTQTANQKAIIR